MKADICPLTKLQNEWHFLSSSFKMYFVHLEMFLILIAEEWKCAFYFPILYVE